MDADKLKKVSKLKEKYRVFRVLVIGRGNAGKTTLLERVCDTTEEPEIYDADGNKIDRSTLAASANRGEHDIEHEMVFKSNPGFRFHDSRGFEAGGVAELDKVKTFVLERSQERKPLRQLHAIWYCIPVDDARIITAAEADFFSKCGTGVVPVIVAFTKFDALDTKAWAHLYRREGRTREQARQEAPSRAIADFEKQQLHLVYETQHPPKGHVYLRKMNEPGADCGKLMQQTAAALSDKTLQQLLVSTQRNNLQLCAEYALQKEMMPRIVVEPLPDSGIKFGVKKWLTNTQKHAEEQKMAEEQKLAEKQTSRILQWFPHFVESS